MSQILPHPFVPPPLHRLQRGAYLATLAVLQIALVIDVAPDLAERLVPRTYVVSGAAWSPAAQIAAQLAAYALSLAGTAVILAFPALALARHAQRGGLRFLGLPRLGIRLAIGGAFAYVAAQALASVAAAPAIAAAGIPGLAASFATGSLAVMAAGALTAEVLRRGIAPPVRVPIAPWHCSPVRIEVIDPPELATRAS